MAENLSTAAQTGLEALDYLDAGKPAPSAWVEKQSAVLNQAAKPRAELLLMVVPPIRKLVDAAKNGAL